MPQRRRCKRHFVLSTTDGPLVTVNPTPGSMLPESFKKAKVRSLEASRDTVGSAPSRRTSRKTPTEGDKGVAPPHVRRPGGGPVLEFAPIAPIPDGFGVPGDDEELARRERLGTLDRQACALCHHTFDRTKLQFRVSRKAIVERQARWGRCALKGKDLTAANLYESCLVCLFCYQFFEETIREACSLLEPPDDDDGFVSNHRERQSPRRSLDAAPTAFGTFGTSTSSALAASQSHVSPPEFVEELRIQNDQRRSQRLLNCLGRDWEAQQRSERVRRFRNSLRDYRSAEASRWRERVEYARQHEAEVAAVGGRQCTVEPAVVPGFASPLAPPANDARDIICDTAGMLAPGSVSPTATIATATAADEQQQAVAQPSILKKCASLSSSYGVAGGGNHCHDADITTSISGGAFSSSSAALLAQPSAGTVSPSLDVDGAGGTTDRPCHSHRSRRGSDGAAPRVVGGAVDYLPHPNQSPRRSTTPPSPSGVDDFGEIDLTDDLRAILLATPRSARGLHLAGGPSAFAVAKEMLKAKKDKKDAGGGGTAQRPGTAPLLRASSPTRRLTKAYRLRVQAAEANKAHLAEDAYLRDCELRGVYPAPSRLAAFYGAQIKAYTNPTTGASAMQMPIEAPWSAIPTLETSTLLQDLRGERSRRLARRSSLLDLHDRRHDSVAAEDATTLSDRRSTRYGLTDVLRFRGSKRFSMYSV